MADGESQLPAVVADRWLSDFSGAVSRDNLPSLASRGIPLTVMAHIRRGLCRKFVVRGDCSVVKEPAPRTGLNCYRRGVEKGIGKCPFIHHDIFGAVLRPVHGMFTKIIPQIFLCIVNG